MQAVILTPKTFIHRLRRTEPFYPTSIEAPDSSDTPPIPAKNRMSPLRQRIGGAPGIGVRLSA